VAENKADAKAAAAAKAERDRLDKDTDRRLTALDRSAHAKPKRGRRG
jgi:hypothetical protein